MPFARRMLSANERRRAKTPGLRRIRLSSSRRTRSRTWWSRFSMPQCARTARPKLAASSRTWLTWYATSCRGRHRPARVSLHQQERETRAAQAIALRHPGGSRPPTSKTSTRRCSWRPCRPRSVVSCRSTGSRSAQSRATASCKPGWLALSRTSRAPPARAALAKVLLAVQGVGGEQRSPHAELPDQGLRRRDLLGRGADLLVRQDQRGLAGEGAQHVRGRRVVQVVEAAPERLAVERDHPRPRSRCRLAERPGMPAEGGLQIGRLERLEQAAERVHGRRAPEARAEGGVQALPVDADEDPDAAVGGGARQDGQHGEEQQVGERVAAALPAARVGDLFQGGDQASERHHGGSSTGGRPRQRRTRRHDPPTPKPALTNGSCPEPNSPGVRRQTAWLVKHKLMRAMAAREAEKPKLSGRVEVDDAYLGGERPGGKRGRGAAGKTPIVAAVETTPERRPKRLRLTVVKGFRKKEVERIAKRDFAPGANVVSDGLSCWPAVEKAGCAHFPMVTGAGKRAANWTPFRRVNTTLGNVKTAIAGTYHHVSAKHAQPCLASFAYRFNRRSQLDSIVERLAWAATRTAPQPYRVIVADA